MTLNDELIELEQVIFTYTGFQTSVYEGNQLTPKQKKEEIAKLKTTVNVLIKYDSAQQ